MQTDKTTVVLEVLAIDLPMLERAYELVEFKNQFGIHEIVVNILCDWAGYSMTSDTESMIKRVHFTISSFASAMECHGEVYLKSANAFEDGAFEDVSDALAADGIVKANTYHVRRKSGDIEITMEKNLANLLASGMMLLTNLLRNGLKEVAEWYSWNQRPLFVQVTDLLNQIYATLNCPEHKDVLLKQTEALYERTKMAAAGEQAKKIIMDIISPESAHLF